MKFSLLAPAVFVTAVAASSLQAQNYVNETFSDNERATQNPPSSLEWAFSSQGAPANTALSASTGALVYTAPAASAQYDTAYFTTAGSPINLADGDSITLSFQFAFSTLVAGDGGFRFGLYNSNGTRLAPGFSSSVQTFSNAAVFGSSTGYDVEANPGATSSTSTLSLRKQFGGGTPATPFSNTGTVGTNKTDAYLGLSANTFYNASLTITRTGTSALISTNINGVTNSGTDAVTGNFSFDTISFFTGSGAVPTASTFSIDNVNVTVTPVPEPSTYALTIGALLLGVVVLRRRRATVSE